MELQLLKLLLTFDFYSRNKRFVERSFFPKELGSLYDTLLYCHDKYEADLTPSELWEMHKERNPTLTKAAKANLSNIVDNLENEELPKEELATDILLSVWRRERAKEVGEKAIEIFTGGEATFHELREIIQKTIDLDLTKFADNFEEVHEELEELLDDGANYEFEFTLTALHEVLPGLGRGNLGIIFARPEVGKTTFAAFLVGEYIRQGHKVAYFGNEEPARRTKLRVISSYLERSAEEIRDNLQDSKDKFNGSGEGLRVFDAVGVTMGEIDNYVESMAPDIVVIDQLDKVRIDGKFQRTDERLKEIYIQARELAKRRNCLVWAISQASADAHDKKYVSFDTMDNSKTGKAGEADLIVGIGKHGGVDEDFLRYLYLSKNKINGRHEIVPCRLDAERARYYD
jgi:replicative DNA helicase